MAQDQRGLYGPGPTVFLLCENNNCRHPSTRTPIKNTIYWCIIRGAKTMANKLGNDLGRYVLRVSFSIFVHWFGKIILEGSQELNPWTFVALPGINILGTAGREVRSSSINGRLLRKRANAIFRCLSPF
jgi:hypothetical protein